MAEALTTRLLALARQELSRTLVALCGEVGAAESSILLPRDDAELVFFASTNPVLMEPEAPPVPIIASFSGLAFRTGQTIAFADAANQPPHFKAVDDLVGSQTREFAAIPFAGESVLGVITLVNRTADAGAARQPFSLPELRRAEALAQELARPVALLAALAGLGAPQGVGVDAELLAELGQLDDGERRVVHALAGALLQNRTQ